MLIDHVKYLSETIGPRPSASAEEGEAATYVAGELSALGYETRIENFPALKTYSWLHVLYHTAILTAWALVPGAPWVSVALSAAGLAAWAMDVSGRTGLSFLFPKSRSSNAVGYRMPKKPMLAKVVVSAHIDSSRSAVFFNPKIVKGFRRTFVLTALAMGATLAAAAVSAAGVKLYYAWIVAGVLNIQTAAAALLLVDRELRGRHTPGAVDNASGVAAMLGVARALADRQFDHLEIEFVGTGAEESGLFGMAHYLKNHWNDPARTLFVNIDHVGTGLVSVTAREGMLLRRDCDAAALGWAGSFPLPSTGRTPQIMDFRTMLTDGYAALARGCRAVSIMAFNPDGTLPNWHWHTDVAGHISEDNLGDAAALALHIIHCLESETLREAGESAGRL